MPNASHQRLRRAQLAEVRLHAFVMWLVDTLSWDDLHCLQIEYLSSMAFLRANVLALIGPERQL